MKKEKVLKRVSKIQRRRLKNILAAKKMKQYELAIAVGIDPCPFSKICSGWWKVPPEFFRRIERKLNLQEGTF